MADLATLLRIAENTVDGLNAELARLQALRHEAIELRDGLRDHVVTQGLRQPEAPPAGLANTFGKVEELRDPSSRRILRVGDRVEVKPSRPRKRDGWVGTIRELHASADPARADEVVVSWPGGSPRTVHVDRIGARKAAQEPAR